MAACRHDNIYMRTLLEEAQRYFDSAPQHLYRLDTSLGLLGTFI